MKKTLIAFYLVVLSIVMFEFTVNEFQTNNKLLCTIEVISETIEKESTLSIDEDIIYPSTALKDVLAGINFTSEQPINTIYNISYEKLQPPR